MFGFFDRGFFGFRDLGAVRRERLRVWPGRFLVSQRRLRRFRV